RIYNVINEVCSGTISEDKLETITEMITLTAADVNKKTKKSKYYTIQKANIPFTGCAMTNGRKAIQSFFKQRNFSNLIYR
ncbi:ISLre2 family transposase, partial [Clostridium sp. LCP25S3_F10]